MLRVQVHIWVAPTPQLLQMLLRDIRHASFPQLVTTPCLLVTLLVTLLTSVFMVSQRLQGKRVRFITGTDEHGEKIADAAKARGMQPQEHCDSIVEEYKALWTQVWA